MRKKFGRKRFHARLSDLEREQTLGALSRIPEPHAQQKREEFDRPEREAELIAEAKRRRYESLNHLRVAFAPMIGRPN